MKFELREIPELTGQRCKIYSILIEGDEKTLFEQFVEENEDKFPNEMNSILKKILSIKQRRGAQDDYLDLKKKAN